MTMREFFAAYAEAHALCPFGVLPNGRIRDAKGRCPLVAVATLREAKGWRRFGAEDGDLAGAALNLAEADRFEIGIAADVGLTKGPLAEQVTWVRFQLLAVIGSEGGVTKHGGTKSCRLLNSTP